MVRQTKNQPNKSDSPDYLEVLTPEQVTLVLAQLVQSNPQIKIEFEILAKNLLESIDIDEIANEIYSSLEEIEMEEVWHRTGNQYDRDYKDPYDIIVDDIEDILDPFVRRISSFIQQNLPYQANALCKGVLKGLHDFEKSSGSEILNELGDGLEFIAQNEILDLWDKVDEIEDSDSIDNFISKNLSDWNL